MNDLNSIEIALSDQTKFRLIEINKIKDYFNSEIQESKGKSKKPSKYIATFDYIISDCFICNRWGNKYYLFYKCYSSPCRRSKCYFCSCIFFKKIRRKKKKKHNKIVMLAKSKLSSIETLMSQALIDLDISHEEFKTIVNEQKKHGEMK